MNGSVSRDNDGKAPHRMPSGTPTSDDSRKPQKITWRLCHRLWCSQGSLGRRGGVRKAVYERAAPPRAARAGRSGWRGVALAGGLPSARGASAFSAANASRSTSMPGG